MKLEDIVKVIVGSNISRVSKGHELTLDTYTYEQLMNDLDGVSAEPSATNGMNIDDTEIHLSKVGEVVFSFVCSKAAIMSDRNKGKLINQTLLN